MAQKAKPASKPAAPKKSTRVDWSKRVGELKRVFKKTGNARDTAKHFGCSEGALRQKMHALGLSGASKGRKSKGRNNTRVAKKATATRAKKADKAGPLRGTKAA